MAVNARRTAVIGIGNIERGDDAVGRVAAQRFRDGVPTDVDVYEQDGEATALVDLLEGRSGVYLIDACSSGFPAGSIHRFDVSSAPLPDRAVRVSTHGFGLGEAIELARALGILPARCIVYAIEGVTFTTGAPLSRAAAEAAAAVAREIRAEIAGTERSDDDA